MAAPPYFWGPPPPAPAGDAPPVYGGWSPAPAPSPFMMPGFLSSPFGTPFMSPYASPYASPGGPAMTLFPGPGSPMPGFASPYASPFGSPLPPPGYFFSPNASPTEIAPAPEKGTVPPEGTAAVQIAPWVAAPPRPPFAAGGPGGPGPSTLANWDVRRGLDTANYPGDRDTRVPLAVRFAEQATYPANEANVALLFDGTGPEIALLNKLWPDGVIIPQAAASIGDIIKAVFEFFQMRMRKEEVELLKEGDKGAANWAALVQAMAARCRASTQLAEVEWNQGLRRVDVLGEARAFGGLRVEYIEEGGWRLRMVLASVEKE